MSNPTLSLRLPFEPDGENFLTQKQIAEKRGVSLRTVIRDIRKYGCPVHDYIGIQPVFTARAFKKMEQRRLAAISTRFGHTMDDRAGGAGIVSMKELRAISRKAAESKSNSRKGKAR